MTDDAYTNHFDDNGDFQDPRAAAYRPRPLSIPTGPRNIQSLNNDVNRTARSVIEHDGTITTRTGGVERGSTAGYGHVEGGPFASMRNENNSRPILASELTTKSVVRVASNGLEMKLGSAIAAGYIIARPDGSYVAAGNTSQATQKKDSETHPDLASEAFADRSADDAFTAIVNETSPGSQIAAVNEIVEKGEIGPNLMGQIASQMGAEPEAVQERLAPVFAAFQEQADTFISQRGVDPEAVYEWARENKSSELKAAMKDHAMKRSTRSYAGVVNSYIATLDKHSPDAILNAEFGPGVTARKERGQILIQTKHGTMTWGSAIRAGLIRLGN